MSKDFMRDYKKVLKSHREDQTDLLKDLTNLMEKKLPVPHKFAYEVAGYALYGGFQPDEAGEILTDFVDLFDENFEVENSVLQEKDWRFLRDLLNTFAEEIDLDILTSIMQEIVSAGGFRD